MIWLDSSSTTPVDPDVRTAMDGWLSGRCGNPSSLHGPGVAAAAAVSDAGREVASLVGGDRWDVIFTSGGTEANALAVLGTVRGGRRARVVVSAIEHPSVLGNAARLADAGADLVKIRPGPDGRVDPGLLAAAVDGSTRLVSLMHGQNEIGTIQPIAEAATAAKARNPDVVFHVDAVQTAGRLPLASALAAVDMVTVSSHKIHGPMGVGALLVRKGARRPAPLYTGGEQQAGARPGTENVPGIVGFGVAARLAAAAAAAYAGRMDPLVRAFLDALGESDSFGPWPGSAARIPGHLAIVVRGTPAQPVLHAMEARGFVVSSGSACHSHSKARSAVLDAVDLPAGSEVIRVVACRWTTAEEMASAGAALREVLLGI